METFVKSLFILKSFESFFKLIDKNIGKTHFELSFFFLFGINDAFLHFEVTWNLVRFSFPIPLGLYCDTSKVCAEQIVYPHKYRLAQIR